jgi:uncharacterized membrane protein
MLPIVELRGAIPVGMVAGMLPWEAFAVAVIGNMLPIPIILLFLRKVLKWLRRFPRFARLVDKLEAKGSKSAEKIRKYEKWGLLIFVAIPLPGTGAWTGSLAAAMLDMKLKDALIYIFGGVVVAGVIITLIMSLGLQAIFPLFVKS